MTIAERPRRFFISYRRRAADDARLAKRLVDELGQAGHEVFIDVDIPLGTDWSAEITGRIRWCDYLVVLLSEDSIDSEMVQGEIRLARHYRREDGSPYIFPVRVRYEDGLDYELTSYLGRLQHILWKNADDDSAVVSAILAAARTKQGARENGTYLSFLGWPYLRTLSLAVARGSVSSGKGLGRRLIALGSMRPGRLPTCC